MWGFFCANALEVLLYIPVSEFVCWLKWLGSRKALAGMQVLFFFGSLWKILSEGVEEDGVGSPVRVTGNPISQESQDHSRMEKDTQRDSKMSQCCQITGREFGKFLQECCPGAGDGGDPSMLPCARYCCRQKWISGHLSWKFMEILCSQTIYSPLNSHDLSEGCCDLEITEAEAWSTVWGLFWVTPSAPGAVTGKVCALCSWNGNSL